MYPIFALAVLNLLMLWGLRKDLFWRQLIFWLIGAGLFYLVKKINLAELIKQKNILYIIILLFLFLPFLLGKVIRGSARWLEIGQLTLQPSELAKPILILFMAKHLNSFNIKTAKNFIVSLILLAVPVAIIFIQPDLGSSAIVLFTLLLLVWLKFPYIKWWLPIFGIGLILIIFSSSFLLHDYQVSRVTSFINPKADPLGEGYNIIQAKLAIGSGGVFGRGYAQGKQTQLAFLPEKHTDFIFAALGEELGFVGVVFTLGFYFLLFWQLLKKISQSKNQQRYYLRIGIFFQLFTQTIINLAMNLQLFPIVGLPLPLLSYGGSSLLSTLLSLALF